MLTEPRRDGRRMYPVSADMAFGISDDLVEDMVQDVVVPQVLAASPGVYLQFLPAATGDNGDHPLLMETSEQAQFLNPAVISFSCGLVFSVLILFYLPLAKGGAPLYFVRRTG